MHDGINCVVFLFRIKSILIVISVFREARFMTPIEVHRSSFRKVLQAAVGGTAFCFFGLALLEIPGLAGNWWLWGIAVY